MISGVDSLMPLTHLAHPLLPQPPQQPCLPFFLKKKFFFLRLFIFETERDRAWMGEGQREGDTESETGSRLLAVSTEPDAGLKLTDREIMTWAEVGRLTDWATQVPQEEHF